MGREQRKRQEKGECVRETKKHRYSKRYLRERFKRGEKKVQMENDGERQRWMELEQRGRGESKEVRASERGEKELDAGGSFDLLDDWTSDQNLRVQKGLGIGR